MDLKDRSILITGGRRVGAELARLLAGRGARIALTYHTSRAPIQALVAEIERAGGEALAVPADLGRADQAGHAVSAVVERFGRIDALVNMASIYRRTPFAELTPADFDAMIATNLASVYHTSVAAAKAMQAQLALADCGLRGKIVSVGDWATDRPYRDYLPYLVAKGALPTLTLALAQELAPDITVNLIQPGPIALPPDLSGDEEAAILADTPLDRLGSPDDANRLILYLLEGTDFATGSTYRIDGGRFLGRPS